MAAVGESWHVVPEPGTNTQRVPAGPTGRSLSETKYDVRFVTPEGFCMVSAWFSTWRIDLPHRVLVLEGLRFAEHGHFSAVLSPITPSIFAGVASDSTLRTHRPREICDKFVIETS